jgi:trigger factor
LKKRFAVLLLAACLLTACGNKSQISTGSKPLDNAVYSTEQISLAPYTGLKAEKKVYTVTEDAVDNAVREALLEYAEYNPVKRPSRESDWVYGDFQASIDGSTVVNEEDYEFILGAEEYGEEFDQKLIGVSVGDTLTFSLDYDEEFTDVEWAGNTVDFEIKVTDIQEEILPEATDDFLKKNMSYNSYDEFREAMRQSVADIYEAESTNELQQDLLEQVIDASRILQYSREDYDKARETIEGGYMSYVEMFGMNSLDELYKSFEMTKEDVEEEIQTYLYRTLVINAIIENESLSLSDDDYKEGVAYYMKENGYESESEFLNDYGEEEIRRQLLEDMALNLLVNSAEITEKEAEYENV